MSDAIAPEREQPTPGVAIWQAHEPNEAWIPEALRDGVPELATYTPSHLITDESRAHDDWSLAGASCRGRSHAHYAQFREDAFAMHTQPGVAILVAADGAGSAKWSRVGAEVACRVAVATLAAQLRAADADLRDALAATMLTVCDRLIALATNGGGSPRDVRTTLLIAVLTHTGAGESLAVCQVGDGGILVRFRDGRTQQLGAGETGMYSGEVSCFVPDADAAVQAERSVVVMDAAGIDSVLLCTDGVEDPFYPLSRHGATVLSQLFAGVVAPAEHFQKQEPHGPVFGNAEMLQRLATWLGFERRGENDDRTLVAAFRACAVAQPTAGRA